MTYALLIAIILWQARRISRLHRIRSHHFGPQGAQCTHPRDLEVEVAEKDRVPEPHEDWETWGRVW